MSVTLFKKMSLNLTSGRFLKIYLFCTLVVVLIIISTQVGPWQIKTYEERRAGITKIKRLQCPDVLQYMLNGSWIEKPYTEQQMENLQYFLHAARAQHFLPYSLQRSDNKCGNVSFDELEGRMNDLHWFRALCDPEGEFPCCYNNQCMPRSKEECQCKECYDMRQAINAEFATWVPSNSTCKITTFEGEEDTCKLLHNMTIYFIGDSFMRHMYISLLALLRSNTHYGPLRHYTAPGGNLGPYNITPVYNLWVIRGLIHGCDRNFIHLRMCMNSIDFEAWECNKTVKLRFMEHARVEHSNLTLKAIDELKGRPNSLVLIGIGIHNDFNITEVTSQLLTPMLTQLSKTVWPRAVWSAMHAPGLLKTPRVISQNTESILRYNAQIKSILDVWGVPVINTFNLTKGTMSFDGAHYGKGINDAKAQIFLNYILELKAKSEFPWSELKTRMR